MTKLVFVIFKALMFQALLVFRSEAQCFNATLMAEKQFGLSDKQFWRAKAHDVEQCAVLCVRRSTCSSINYDTQSRLCELNNGTKADTPTKTGPYLLYSEFKSWPSSIDPHCYSRPCTHLDVCLPGSLANGNNDECSHACIRTVYDVCPMPEVGVSNGRTVGTQNTLTCGKGFIGGGTAKCLDSKQWDKELSPCIPIYRHPCNDSVLCSKINATCHNDTCECVGQANSFDEALKECVIDCGEPDALEPSLNATYVNADDKFTRSITCEDEYYPTAGSVSTINCTADGWNQVNFSCYTCGVPTSVSGANLTGNGRTRQYECGTGLYHNPKTGSGEITCQENGEWSTTGFKCGGLRLKNGTQQQVLKSYSGYLEIFDGGEWKAVHEGSWTWKATMVACKTLFNFTYGGTYHTDWFGEENPNQESGLIKLDRLECTGNESVLEQCTYDAKAEKDFSKEIAVTCFNYSITTPDSVKTIGDPTNSERLLLVNISGELGAMCDDWGGANTQVACQSINSSWTKAGESKNLVGNVSFYTNYVDCVDDSVPHLFYCRNQGWGYEKECDMAKLIGIKCKPN